MIAAQKLYPDGLLVFSGSQEKTLRDFISQTLLYQYDFLKAKQVVLANITHDVLIDLAPDLTRLMAASGRMILRNVERKPVQGFFSSLGVALSMAILVLGMFMFDSIVYMMDLQFRMILDQRPRAVAIGQMSVSPIRRRNRSNSWIE